MTTASPSSTNCASVKLLSDITARRRLSFRWTERIGVTVARNRCCTRTHGIHGIWTPHRHRLRRGRRTMALAQRRHAGKQPAFVGATDARGDASHVASIRYRDGGAATATGRTDEACGWIAVAAACLKPRRRADYAGGASRRGSRPMAETAFRAAARSMRPEHRTRGATGRQWSDLLGSNQLAAHEEDWCGREDSNLHGFTRCHLKAVRLPIPPRPHGEEDKGQARCPAKTALV